MLVTAMNLNFSDNFYFIEKYHLHTCKYTQFKWSIPTNLDNLSPGGKYILHFFVEVMQIRCYGVGFLVHIPD